jgi:GNAT superfamily N-acetyltransferase
MIEVRKARTQNDLAECHVMQMEVFKDGEHRDTAKDHWWLALVDKQPAGFGCLRLMGDEGTGPTLGYHALAGVLKAFRGQGIQRRLLKAREAFARAKGCATVCTYTAWRNWPSANSLIREGYTLYTPNVKPWGLPYSLYFRKVL